MNDIKTVHTDFSIYEYLLQEDIVKVIDFYKRKYPDKIKIIINTELLKHISKDKLEEYVNSLGYKIKSINPDNVLHHDYSGKNRDAIVLERIEKVNERTS